MLQPSTSTRTCEQCQQPFMAFTSFARVCGKPKCQRGFVAAIAKQELAKVNAERVKTRAQREALKPRGQWLAEAQKEFNAYIRLRDASARCISCDRDHFGQWHAGHYLSTGARPELRFEPSNVHKQCQPCNTHLHGNLVRYRAALVKKLGADQVAWLEGPHAPKKYAVDDLKQIRGHYRALAKQLEKAG